MRLIFILAFCMLFHVFFSQTICKGRLIDATTLLPVEFANIGIVGKGLGTVSNEKGEYTFTVSDSLLYETLRIHDWLQVRIVQSQRISTTVRNKTHAKRYCPE